MISRDKVAHIIVQLVAFFFDLGSILPKIHMPPEKGPGAKTKRLVFLPLSFIGHVSFFGIPPKKLTSQWKIHHLKMHFLF